MTTPEFKNLSDFLDKKNTKDLKAVIGIDPAISCTGWSLILIDKSSKYLIEFGTISPPSKIETQSEQLRYIYIKTNEIIGDLLDFLINKKVKIVGIGVEIPAVLLGGRQRATRDMTQIQAIGAIRAALGGYGPNLPEHIVRPISVHSIAGANQVNYFKKMKLDLKKKGWKKDKIQSEVKKIKKGMVKDWVIKNFIISGTIKKFDESDSVAIAMCAYKELI